MKKNRLLFCLKLFSTITAGNYSNYNYDSNPVINPPIIVATICGNLSEVKKECTPTTMNVQNIQGQTALMHSCIHGSGDIFTFLIENNADLNIKDNSGKTALDYAIKHNRPDMIEFLLLSGADDTLSLEEALKKAAQIENIKKQTQNMFEELSKDLPDINIIKSCIDNGADVNTRDRFYGKTALDFAIAHNRPEMIEFLLLSGADDTLSLNEALKKAAEFKLTENLITEINKYDYDINIIKSCIDNGADVNARDYDGWTALMHAASRYGYTEMVKLLIDAGADVNAENRYGHTALKSAANNGHIETVKLLIAAGADIDAQDKYGRTVFHSYTLADFPQDHEIIRLLKNHKTKLDAQKKLDANKNIVKKTSTNKQNNRAKLTNKAKIILSKKIRRK